MVSNIQVDYVKTTAVGKPGEIPKKSNVLLPATPTTSSYRPKNRQVAQCLKDVDNVIMFCPVLATPSCPNATQGPCLAFCTSLRSTYPELT